MIGTYKYLNGPIAVSSSWVKSIGYVEEEDKSRGISAFLGRNRRQGIAIMFKDGITCWYPGTTIHQFRALHSAPSKGKWIHKHIINHTYEEI